VAGHRRVQNSSIKGGKAKRKSGTLGFLEGQNMASTVLEWQLIDPDEKTGEAREIRQSPGD